MEQSRLIKKIPIKEKIMALTFDDNLNAANAFSILNTLNQNNVQSTFFLVGKSDKLSSKLTNIIIHHGHEIGNHSYSHPSLTELNANEIKLQIEKAEEAILKASNHLAPKPLFRPPYGYYNSIVLDVVSSIGYPWTILWSIDTKDWNGTPVDIMVQKVLDKAQPGAIVLMHLQDMTNTVEALPEIIKGLKSKGYKLAKISQMLSKAYSSPSLIKYVIKPGDTLMKISRRFDVIVNNLVETNNISNPDLIHVGQIILIPAK